MAYALKAGRSPGTEIRRIVAKQISCTLDELSQVNCKWREETVHEARRHVKKAKAAMRLARAVAGHRSRRIERSLSWASRSLAEIADADSVRNLLLALSRSRGFPLSSNGVKSLRQYLDRRLAIAHRRALERALNEKLTGRLAKTRERVSKWNSSSLIMDDVASAAERTIRRSRMLMFETRTTPSAKTYHAWRCRVKDHWLQLRLLNRVCAGQLAGELAAVEQLDGVLGACHDLALLSEAVVESSIDRDDKAKALRFLRRHQMRRRREAETLARPIYRLSPRVAARHLVALWQSATDQAERRPCAHAA